MNERVWSRDFGGSCKKGQMKTERLLVPPRPGVRGTLGRLPITLCAINKVASCILYFQLELQVCRITFFPGSLVYRHSWMEVPCMDSGKPQRSGLWLCFFDLPSLLTPQFKENIKEKGKTYESFWTFGVNGACASARTRGCRPLPCLIPSKFMTHRWTVVGISIFCQGK